MIPNIFFILFVNLRMDSPANIFLASKEPLDYLDNKLVHQTQADLVAETIPEQWSNSGQKKVWHVGSHGPGEVRIITSRRHNALIFVFELEIT